MGYLSLSSLFLVFVFTSKFSEGQYAVPTVKFEAFTPKGLRISIPADKGVELFAFHGKVNKTILQIEPGEFSEDVTKPSNGRFTYYNPSIKLNKGDIINYWVFVQHEQLGFRRDDQSWTVDNLISQTDPGTTTGACSNSITKVLGKTKICSGDEIINYRFTETSLDPDLWLIEQFIPYGPDWEYVIYKNEQDVIAVENKALRIKPKVVEENAMKNLVIDGCTRSGNPQECTKAFQSIFQPPIVSGRLVSKGAFCFVEVNIRAKLPQGDWIFPEIYLEDINDPQRRILLAFARGNKVLTDGGNEIGGKMLVGGPYMVFHNVHKTPIRTYLASYNGEKHIGDDWHTFTLKWSKDHMDLHLDGKSYGEISAAALEATGFNRETMVRLVLGVGVGGVHNFPDYSTSGSYEKPWKSKSRDAVKNFLNNKEKWQASWNGENQLLVEYITVKAL